MKSTLWALALTGVLCGRRCAGQQQANCSGIEPNVDLSGNDCCGGTKTLNSTGECCAACQAHEADGCKFWTFASDLSHCYLKTSDAGRQSRDQHVSGSVEPPSPAPHPSPAPAGKCPVVPEPPAAPHPPLPAGQYRYPYDNPCVTRACVRMRARVRACVRARALACVCASRVKLQSARRHPA